MVREGHIDGPGGRLWYAIHGDGRAGVPLLVVHGGPGFLSVPDVVADLADEFDQRIALDQRPDDRLPIGRICGIDLGRDL